MTKDIYGIDYAPSALSIVLRIFIALSGYVNDYRTFGALRP